ncbi:uncharacterized protein [Maniola hyperantus]|uniref:uncharacterized protein n=1 Tax=Aphantopus hyperantus TaxID=2795564 RepID=UPI001569C962|nr:uncharacterized protein LOC117994883 [Maniola hyperantus]
MFRSPRDVGVFPPAKVYDKTYDKIEVELYGCDLCADGGWTSETEVEIHKTKVHYKRAFMNELKKRDDYCYICIKQCADHESVVKHIKSEHLLSSESCLRVEREIFICNDCSAIFFNKDNLIIHLRYAHLDMSNMELIKCVICLKNIQVRNMPAHFYLHNIQSVSTCRICLCKCLNTKALKLHLRQHPYYLKCDMCYYDTSRVESFQNHILSRHRTSVKVKDVTTKKELTDNTTAKNLMTVDNQNGGDKNFVTDDVKSENLMESDDDTLIEADLLTVIEISDMDTVADNMTTIKNLMSDKVVMSKSRDRREEGEEEFLMTGVRRKRRNLKGIKKMTRKKKNKMTTEVATALSNEMQNFVSDANLANDTPSDEDLLKVNPVNEDSMILPDLMTDDIKDPNLTDAVVTNENSLMSLFEINDKEISVTSKNFMTGETIKEELTDEVMSDNNLVTVIQISDQGVSTANIAVDPLRDNLESEKDFISNEVSLTNASRVGDTSLTVKVETVKDLKPNETDKFKRYFIPETPSYLRLQNIAGVRGIRLSNDVRICILCREICVGLEEMRSHINEHAVKKEKVNNYECSCGEKFTNKVLLKHHAFKSKHNI